MLAPCRKQYHGKCQPHNMYIQCNFSLDECLVLWCWLYVCMCMWWAFVYATHSLDGIKSIFATNMLCLRSFEHRASNTDRWKTSRILHCDHLMQTCICQSSGSRANKRHIFLAIWMAHKRKPWRKAHMHIHTHATHATLKTNVRFNKKKKNNQRFVIRLTYHKFSLASALFFLRSVWVTPFICGDIIKQS